MYSRSGGSDNNGRLCYGTSTIPLWDFLVVYCWNHADFMLC